jgi:hypothetical protein
MAGFLTLLYKELLRFWKVGLQTIFAPIVSVLLYLMIFSHVLEEHVQAYPGVAYATFLIPGLIMMAMLQNAFANSSSSLIQSKVTGNLVFVLLSPLLPATSSPVPRRSAMSWAGRLPGYALVLRTLILSDGGSFLPDGTARSGHLESSQLSGQINLISFSVPELCHLPRRSQPAFYSIHSLPPLAELAPQPVFLQIDDSGTAFHCSIFRPCHQINRLLCSGIMVDILMLKTVIRFVTGLGTSRAKRFLTGFKLAKGREERIGMVKQRVQKSYESGLPCECAWRGRWPSL